VTPSVPVVPEVIGRFVASTRVKAGVVSLCPNCNVTPPKFIVLLARAAMALDPEGRVVVPPLTVHPFEPDTFPVPYIVACVGLLLPIPTFPVFIKESSPGVPVNLTSAELVAILPSKRSFDTFKGVIVPLFCCQKDSPAPDALDHVGTPPATTNTSFADPIGS